MLNPQELLLKKIRELDFSLKDLNLYLDTHPNCRHGLAMFRKYNTLREEAVKEYTEKYGPLVPEQSCDTQHWCWIDDPFPWEV